MAKKNTKTKDELMIEAQADYQDFDARIRSIEQQINDLLKVMIEKKDIATKLQLLKKLKETK